MERLTRDIVVAMSKEELQDVVETLQMKLEVAEKEIETLKADAETGKKYKEHLQKEAIRLVRAVDGENAPILKLIDRADVDTLKEITDEYFEKGKDKFKSTSQPQKLEEEQITIEALQKADYKKLLEIREKFMKEA
ncbi:hypothetical protein [Thermodesulfovibrio thiophilus]|uniref:hypothetical protein n=1 Tax=Thermodesulfovibrio thiophilus TaxID=340095 RepID=UPI00041991BC|nr:hypothetical protein [Thermodesulfovibrio thiophilus]